MRLNIILVTMTLLCCCVVADAKNWSEEKTSKKKCKSESCEYKKVDKYKESDENKNFRWNRNFKNHKNNIYDVDKKETESVYKPKFKKSYNEEFDGKKHLKKDKKRQKYSEEEDREGNRQKLKKKKLKVKIEDSASAETSEVDDDNKKVSTEIQCDSVENTCRVE
ncbi:hypothetical protein FQR65_LT07585 [Abscondita terminalis]|nr:hypothetical protein FQR65_LT07585 [Abscondita terminalis]